MSELQAIKDRLLDEDKIVDIFEAMGCEFVTVKNGRVEAQLPDKFHSNNSRSVQCKMNEHLTCSIRSQGDFKNGDIFSLVSYIVNDKRDDEIRLDLNNAKTFICKNLGWTEFLKGGVYITKKDYVAPLKAILKETKRKREIHPNEAISEDVLNNYLPYPSYDWIQEGISYKTQMLYGIGFDLESKRITIPMRNRFGKLIGVKARILNDSDDDRKYLYLYPFNNSQELFNFHYAHTYVLIEKKIYIFEGEKSCMKMFEAGIYNCVAIGSSDITDVQAEIIKSCGMDVEIVICYDKDKTANEIRELVKPLQGRVVKSIIDTQNLIGEKMSPIDKGIEVFQKLESECLYEVE